MNRDKAIREIVFLETTAEHYCAKGSKRERDCLEDAYQLRMQQEPPETRKLNQLRSIIRQQSSG